MESTDPASSHSFPTPLVVLKGFKGEGTQGTAGTFGFKVALYKDSVFTNLYTLCITELKPNTL